MLIFKIEKNTVGSIGEFFIALFNNLIETEDENVVRYLKDIKELKFSSKINDLSIYGSKCKELDDEIQKVFDSFIGLYYLPPYFWYVLLKKGS